MKIGKAGQELTQQKNDRGTIEHFEKEGPAAVTAFDALAERQRDRHPNDEQKEREDQIGRRPAIPFGMFQRPIDMRPRTGVVHQNHAGDRQAAEDVEKEQSGVLSCYYGSWATHCFLLLTHSPMSR